MKNLYVIGEKELALEDKRNVILNYLLVEEYGEISQPLYGIQIIQMNNGFQGICEYTDPISHSKAYVMDILNLLIANHVFASCLIETVDDLIT